MAKTEDEQTGQPKPSSDIIDRRYLACLAARTAARNSASVELVAIIDWVLHL